MHSSQILCSSGWCHRCWWTPPHKNIGGARRQNIREKERETETERETERLGKIENEKEAATIEQNKENVRWDVYLPLVSPLLARPYRYYACLLFLSILSIHLKVVVVVYDRVVLGQSCPGEQWSVYWLRATLVLLSSLASRLSPTIRSAPPVSLPHKSSHRPIWSSLLCWSVAWGKRGQRYQQKTQSTRPLPKEARRVCHLQGIGRVWKNECENVRV